MSETNSQNRKSKDGKRVHRRFVRINGKLIAESFSRKTDADRWFFEKKREKELSESGLSLPMQLTPVEEFADQWLQSRKANGKPLSSWECDNARVRLYVAPAFGKQPMQRITTREWERFLDSKVASGKMSPATRNRIRSLLSKMYNDAHRQGVVTSNPITIIPKLREGEQQWNYWHTKEEISIYLAEAAKVSPSFFICAMLALNTGARVGEILAFDWDAIQLEQRRLHIWRIFEEASHTVCARTKGHKSRWLGINDALYEALVEHRRHTSAKHRNASLVCQASGEHFTQHQIRDIHTRVCKDAGLKVIRVHDLRHTYASHYVMNGGSLAELQGILGHSVPSMTQKYAHLAPGFLEGKAGVVNFSWKLKNASVISLAPRQGRREDGKKSDTQVTQLSENEEVEQAKDSGIAQG